MNSLQNEILVEGGVITLTDADNIVVILKEGNVSVTDVWNNQIEVSNTIITTSDALSNVMVYQDGTVTVTKVATEELLSSVETQMAEVKMDAEAVLEDVSAVYAACYASTDEEEGVE